MIDRRGLSAGLLRLLALGLAALLAASPRTSAQSPQSLPGDFAAAVARLGLTPTLRPSTVEPNPPRRIVIGLDRYRPDAEALRVRFGTGSLPYLTGLIAGIRSDDLLRTRRELAFATLALIAEDESAARVLGHSLSGRKPDDLLPLVAATYAPVSLGRRFGLEALSGSPSRPRALGDAAALLRFFGDPEDLHRLERTVGEALPDRDDGKSRIGSDVLAMRQRLDRPPAERAAWVEDDLAIWRAARYTHDRSASGDQGLMSNAYGLAARARIRTAYLKARLKATPIHPDELFLVISAAKYQAEGSLTPELVDIVTEGRRGWQTAANALMSIGDPGGLEALRALLLPISPNPASSEAEDVRRDHRTQLISHLTGQNVFGAVTPATLDFWTRLSEDPAYPPAERAAFAHARDIAKSILSTNPEGFRL